MPKELSSGSSIRGAQFGRADHISEPDFPVKFHLCPLRWVDWDYDEGGAYWGGGEGNFIYHAWGDAKEEEQEVFTRARNRQDAKVEIISLFPNAKFYR